MQKIPRAAPVSTLHHVHLIRAMVECLRPEPMKTIADPACGTGGFFLAAYDWMTENHELDKEQKQFLKVQNLLWQRDCSRHPTACIDEFVPAQYWRYRQRQHYISPNDSLIAASETRYDYVLANPPFGKKSSRPLPTKKANRKKKTSPTTARIFG